MSFNHFLDEIGRYPLLSAEEEITLARAVQAWLPLRDKKILNKKERAIARRGKRAYDSFFTCNLRLVVHTAKKFRLKATHLTIDDLTQEGCIGLSRAIEKFDPERGYKFSTYAMWWIRQACMRAIEIQDRTIRLPVTAVQKLMKVKRFVADYQRDTGNLPTHVQIREHAEISPKFYEAYMLHYHDCGSLDLRVGNNDESSDLSYFIEDKGMDVAAQAETDALLQDMEGWLKLLDDEDRKFLTMRYGLNGKMPLSHHQMGMALNISRAAAHQREMRSLTNLRKKARLVVPAHAGSVA